jgi:hypothetical protein
MSVGQREVYQTRERIVVEIDSYTANKSLQPNRPKAALLPGG